MDAGRFHHVRGAVPCLLRELLRGQGHFLGTGWGCSRVVGDSGTSAARHSCVPLGAQQPPRAASPSPHQLHWIVPSKLHVTGMTACETCPAGRGWGGIRGQWGSPSHLPVITPGVCSVCHRRRFCARAEAMWGGGLWSPGAGSKHKAGATTGVGPNANTNAPSECRPASREGYPPQNPKRTVKALKNNGSNTSRCWDTGVVHVPREKSFRDASGTDKHVSEERGGGGALEPTTGRPKMVRIKLSFGKFHSFTLQTLGWGGTPCVTFRRVVAPLRGPGQSPVLPFACCVGSLLSVGRCGRCSCWCRFRVRGAQ